MVGTASEQWSPDIKLAAVPMLRLKGRAFDVLGRPAAKVSVVLDKGLGPALTEVTNEDGTFEFAAVSKGEWRLSAGMEKGNMRLKAVLSVELSDNDLENVELRLSAPFALRGNLVMEIPNGVPAPEPPMIDLLLVSDAALPSDSGRDTFSPISSDEGVLTVPNVYPGSYQVQPISDSPVPFYLDSIRLGERDALDRLRYSPTPCR